MTFREFLKTLTVAELLMFIKDLLLNPDDKQHLNWALQELGNRGEHI